MNRSSVFKTTQIFFAQLQDISNLEKIFSSKRFVITFTYLSHTTEGRNCNLLLEIVTKLMYDMSVFKTTYFQIISHFLIFEEKSSFVDTSGGWSDLAMFSYLRILYILISVTINSQTLPNYLLSSPVQMLRRIRTPILNYD